MKKKVWMILAAVLLLAVLFVPVPSGIYKDGGTRAYTALTYKIVDWNRLTGVTVYEETKLYLFPNNFKSIDALWEQEKKNVGMLTIDPSDWNSDPVAACKPVIYLYPEAETDVSVNLILDGKLTCTYPAYGEGWKVTAAPDGTLTDNGGQTYNYLYWEGEINAQWDLSKGFCVKGGDTAAFLEEALEKLGLNRKEANEFIVYWLPLMEQNPYNIISFQTGVYTDAAELQIDPTPDTLIRVFMTWKAAESFVELPEQELAAPERIGFTVVEWGGTEIKES